MSWYKKECSQKETIKYLNSLSQREIPHDDIKLASTSFGNVIYYYYHYEIINW